MSEGSLEIWTNGRDFVIAERAEYALLIACEHWNCKGAESDVAKWHISDVESFTLPSANRPGLTDVGEVTLTASEWIDLLGAGFLCTTET